MHSACILAYCLMQSACGNLFVYDFYHRLTTSFIKIGSKFPLQSFNQAEG